VIKGDVITSRTRKSLVMSQNSLIVTNDVQNMVVVETPDAVFVSSLENSREVKNIVESLKTDHRREYQSHITESYQWGSLKQLDENSKYHIATYTVRKNEIFRGMLNAGSFWHVFILRGRARLSFSNQQPLDLKPFQSQTLSAPGELALINSGDQPVEAVIIRTQKGETE
jgi:mannose-1-phosphate guanylyltransferase